MLAAVELATAYISLVPSLKGAAGKISDELNPAAASSGAAAGQHLGTSIIGAAAKWAAPLAAAVGFGAVIKSGFDEAKDAAAGTAQLAAGIASTGNAAHLSVDGLNSLASEIQNYSGQTDDSIVKSEQLLQTFTNIKNTGPDKIFDMATKASADMAAKFGGDASSQAVVLGKALNDPVKGITALTRVGVTFTDEQKKTIAAMVKTGDVAGAQKVILKELGTEFGGAAKAAGESFPGQLDRVHRAFEDLSQGVVQGFLPVMGPALEGVITILQKVGPIAGDAAQKVADKFAAIGGTIKGVFTGLKSLIMDGDVTSTLLRSLGVEEDSPIIGGLMFLQDKFWAVFRGIQDFVAGFKIPSIMGPENMGLNKFADAGAKVHGFLLDVKGGFQDLTGGIRAFFAAFKDGGDDVTSSGFAGFLEGLGLQARKIFDGIGPILGPLIPQLLALWGALSPVQLIFKSIEPLLPQLLGVFGQLAMVIGGTLSTALTTLLPVFMQLQAVFVRVFSQVLATVLPVVVQLITLLGQTFAHLIPIVVPIITHIVTLAMTLVSQLVPILMRLVSAVMPMVVTILGAVLQAIGPVIQMIAGLLIPIIMALMPVVTVVFGVIANVVTAAMQIVMGIIQVVTGIISGNWSQVWEGILNIFSGIWNTIAAVVTGVLAIIGSVVVAGLSYMLGVVGSILGSIGSFFASTWNNVIGGVSGFIGNLLGYFYGLPGQIMGALAGAGTWLYNAGRDIINGLISGIGSMMGAIGSAILSLIPGPIVGVFKAALGIASPSKVFRGFGKNIVEGLILGTGDKTDDLSSTMRGLVTVPDVPSFGASTASMNGTARIGHAPVYVQNPFTGEYLLSRVGSVADNRVSAADRQSTYVRPGRR